MKNQIKITIVAILGVFIVSCSTESPVTATVVPPTSQQSTTDSAPEAIPMIQTRDNQIRYLALGDSYTIGQSVCQSCRFPVQLQQSLENTNTKNSFSLKIIAQTGWTTSDLISAINSQNLISDYDLVTLLIGVNNQYQRRPFSLFEKEFPELVNKSIALAKGNKTNLIVVSIPDYAYTPFGQGSSSPATISAEIDNYNTFAKNYCEARNIRFINITDITRKGLTNKSLVTNDGLHPSEEAYRLFVERIAPKAAASLNK
ncbi:SGNH/GDSL hydrolase family protein [Flavobacterium hiemivividum]|uniref:SGNH/GDSL hydrolase family protein n=1 Tax=Flavobacterium hiemivividum TaxID=2541734 RepID=A0A4R5CZX4_9FLAO|nr:SGNH/GDSL hydrolase family protein [Flavobacterium hiemivividum]TDE05120.1 SGNH/GDSL hydrolase family protein [Flavobacterium hiemivividum]